MTQNTVFSAQELSASEQKLVESYLGSVPKYQLDKTLIAGIRIATGDSQIELSLSNLLDTMGKSLS